MAAVPSTELIEPKVKNSAPPPPPPEEQKPPFLDTVKTFPRSFWMGCTIEMWERLAWYGLRVVLPIYIMQADEPGGLHFTSAQKGTIYGVWALVQSLIPMISGGFADRYGYKKVLAAYVTINCTAFIMMANVRSYPMFFASCLLLGFGTALFKPAIQGTLAQSLNPKNSSVGWGFFYWLVNVGGMIGPFFANFQRGHGWQWVFYGCAAVTSLNYLMLFTYPNVESGADQTKSMGRTAIDTLKNLLDFRLWIVIAIFSGFWMMLYQLWDFMPNFYADWVESSALSGVLPSSWIHQTNRGPQLLQEYALNINSFMIVAFVVLMSHLVRKVRVLTAMTAGVLIATLGTFMLGTSPNIFIVLFGIVLFSLGEMLTGPKKTEYFALIAPKGKKALYLGYLNIPIAIGQGLGAFISGAYYGKHGEKATLAIQYLNEHTDYRGAVDRKNSFDTLVKVLGQDGKAVNQLLWDTYHPYTIWYIFSAIGVCSLVGMLVFSRVSKRWKDMDV
jgi:proton-dependent oligopeptide transporter, POT family